MTLKLLTPPPRSNQQVREYVEAVERGFNSYFVVQNGKGWYVRKASTTNSNGTLYKTKREAMKSAKAKAAVNKAEVIVFDNKGTLLSRQITK